MPEDDDLSKVLAEAFEADEITENPVTPPVEEPNTPPAEEEKKNEPADPADKKQEEDEPGTPPADPAKPAEEDPAKPKDPEAPVEPQTPPAEQQPLTEESIRKVLAEMRTEERNSGQELQTATNDVMQAYYPDGLSNVLVDQSTGKELRTPQDVVDASGGEMSMEQAAQWLMNEQYKLDQNINDIKQKAEQVAETTLNWKRDTTAVLEKYDSLFKAYPSLQQKAYNLMMQQTKIDADKGVVLQAPDVMELYDTYLEPYRLAYEFATKQSATNPVTPPAPAPAATPSADDRMDEGGDAGASPVNDPNDFAQQVNKELASPF